MAEETARGVLSGLRVVVCGGRIAALLTAQLLHDQGAEVVSILDKSGLIPSSCQEPLLSAMLGRGFVEARLDLTMPEHAEQLRRLLCHADVAIEDLPEKASRSLWALLDGSGIRDQNKGLVLCRIPAFPAGDPRAGLPDYEAVVGAAGGLFERPIGPPRFHNFLLGSVMAGLFAGCAVMAALIARLRDGLGQEVEVSRLRSNYFAQIIQVLMKSGVPRGFLTLRMIGTPFMRTWKCRDGRFVYLHVTLPGHAARLLDVLETLGFAQQVAALRGIISAETLRDPSQVKSIREAKKIARLLEGVFIERSADEWERTLGAELCCVKVRTAVEWVRDSIEAGMDDVCEIQDPEFGPIFAPGRAITIEGVPWRPISRLTDPKAIEQILSRWQARPQVYRGPEKTDPPLQGYRIADLTRVIAGPCAGRILAELGADVVSIQNPTTLDWALAFHLMFNPGKKSVTVDFTKKEGQRALWAILRDLKPDALIQNYRHLDIARSLGIGPEVVREAFPDIVYTHLNAYGNEGGWRDRPGFEQVVQAVSGIQMTYGGGAKPRLLPTPAIDIGSGLLGAFATLVGLYNRGRTGRGCFTATHLTRVAVLFQLPEIAKFHREQHILLSQGRDSSASDKEVVSEIVRTFDCWAIVAGPSRDVLRLVGAQDSAKLSDSLGRMWHATAGMWQRRAQALGISERVVVLPLVPLKRIIESESRISSNKPAVFKREYPGVAKPLVFLRCPIRMYRTALPDISATPLRGQHTKEFLERVGIDVPEGAGVIPYPRERPFILWLVGLVRWGYFAWRSGNL